MCKKTHLSCWRWLRSSSDNVRLNIPRNFWNLFLLSFHGHFRHCDRNINANIVPVDMTVCKFVYNYYIPYTHTQHTFLLPHSLSCRFFFRTGECVDCLGLRYCKQKSCQKLFRWFRKHSDIQLRINGAKSIKVGRVYWAQHEVWI